MPDFVDDVEGVRALRELIVRHRAMEETTVDVFAARLDGAGASPEIRAQLLAGYERNRSVLALMSGEQAITQQLQWNEHARTEQLQRFRGLLEWSGVPELHIRNLVDEAPEPGEALSAVREFIDSEETLLVLLGAVGTRKTGAACWGVAEYLRRQPGRVLEVPRFVHVSKLAAAGSFGRDAHELRDEVEGAPFLVVDDVGSEYDKSGFFASQFSALVDARYGAMRKTIFTANLTPDKFKELYGERTVDRLRETGTVFVVAGGSQRKKARLRLVVSKGGGQ